MRLCCLLLITLALAPGLGACSASPGDALVEAREALAETRYDDAVAAARGGLAGEPDEITAWGLDLVVLEALARSGRGEETVAQLEKLARSRPSGVPPTQYSATADQLRVAGDGVAAIQVLDLGLKRFPGDTVLAGLIDASKSAPSAGSDELDMLRTLGYVE